MDFQDCGAETKTKNTLYTVLEASWLTTSFAAEFFCYAFISLLEIRRQIQSLEQPMSCQEVTNERQGTSEKFNPFD